MSSVAKIMKPDLEERMNIQKIPWIESDFVKMEELYTRLTIEKHINKAHGIEKESIDHGNDTNLEYTKLFEEENQHTKRILVKGDPGIGKTTFLRKVAWDWAKEIFKPFSLIFLIILRFVNPSHSIEEMIVEQNPILKGSEICPQTIKQILQEKGEGCLVLLDGYDEISDNLTAITDLLRKKTYPKCNIILTSRPHASIIDPIRRFFNIVACIEGFSKDKAKEYIGKIIKDKSKRDAVMEYSESNEIEEMWRYPVLIMFVCLLVNDEFIDIDIERLSLYEVYIRLLECLYKRYVVRENLPEDPKERDEIFLKLGKIALEGLIEKKYGFKKSFIVNNVGEEIFKYGILIADIDHRKMTHDMAVFFPHRSIQEFLAAKYLVTQVDTGLSKVSKLLKRNDLNLNVEDNITFFAFAFDIYNTLPEEFRWGTLESLFHKSVDKQLKSYVAKQLNKFSVEIRGISMSNQTCDILMRQLSRCNKIRELHLERIKLSQGFDSLVKGTSTMRSLHLIRCSYDRQVSRHSDTGDLNSANESNLTEIHVACKQISEDNSNLITKLLTFRFPSLTYLTLSEGNLGEHHIKLLGNINLRGHTPNLQKLDLYKNINLSNCLEYLFKEKWSNLGALLASRCNLVAEDITSLSNANFAGKVPNMRKLNLNNNVRLSDFIHCLLNTKWHTLLMLVLQACKLTQKDLKSIDEANGKGNLPALKHLCLAKNFLAGKLGLITTSRWARLEILEWENCSKSDARSLSVAVNHRLLRVKKLKVERFERWRGGCCICTFRGMIKEYNMPELEEHTSSYYSCEGCKRAKRNAEYRAVKQWEEKQKERLLQEEYNKEREKQQHKYFEKDRDSHRSEAEGEMKRGNYGIDYEWRYSYKNLLGRPK